jgi:hypothetical protein
MAKALMISCLLFLSIVFIAPITSANESDKETESNELNDPEMDCTKKMSLTVQQQKQLDAIYLRIRRDYSDLIHVYSQAGALTPAQTKIRHIMLHNYIKTFYKRNYRWCSEHEADEWEEEWYNND